MFWMQLLAVIACGILIWILWRFVQSNPGLFTKANFGQTMYTLGWVALFLIAVVALAVFSLGGG